MKINKYNIKELLEKYRMTPSKSLGQNYLLNEEISEKIVNAIEINDKDFVIEIGPGLGSLTHFIIKQTNYANFIDYDLKSINALKELYPLQENLFIHQNALDADLSKAAKIVSNLPYNITSDLLVKILSSSTKCKRMVLMCQKENYAHFSSLSGSEYGPISIYIHLMGSIKQLFNVSSSNYYPAPNCVSTVFVIDINIDIEREKMFKAYKLATRLFLNRRKTISNNLSSYLGDKEKANMILNELGIGLTKRPEELSPVDYLNLSATISKEKKVN